MDERDGRILKAIADLGDASPHRIEEATGIPKSTVHYRLNRLHEEGLVTNDLYDVDLEAVGLTITVVSEILARYDEGYHVSVGEKLSDIEGVNQVYFTMGDTDFVAIANLGNRAMVERLIEEYESIPEVERTSSRFVISTIKNDQRPLRNYSIETLVALD